MKVVFLIGNGFDLNLGLKTSYQNFYDYYNKVHSQSDLIRDLKEHIEEYRNKNWSDLEVALGDYTDKIKSVEDFLEIRNDIVGHLGKYILREEIGFDQDAIDNQLFFGRIASPEKYLTPALQEKVTRFRQNWGTQLSTVNIISFNYTKTLERIVGENYPIKLGADGARLSQLIGIHHVHGLASGGMVLGVNDTDQIQNITFHEELEVSEAFIKDVCNGAMEHGVEQKCKNIIKNANLICIYGSSLGKSDLLWWDLIVQHLLKNEKMILVIYIKDDDLDPNTQYLRPSLARTVKENFLTGISLDQSERKIVEEKIHVAVNSEIFSFEGITAN